MEEVLDVYIRPYDSDYPVVCLDETSKQLIKETRLPLPRKPGHPQYYDYEYERNGVCNLFMLSEPLAGWNRVGSKINWRFTTQDARIKLKRLYPSIESP